MTKNEIRTNIKDTMVERLLPVLEDATKIDDYTYAVPMGTAEDNGHPLYAKIEIKCVNWYDTKNCRAFNLEDKVAAYTAVLEERARKAAEKDSTN